jgi:hypothetical protein
MPKQHFRKAMAGIIAVMLLFSLAVLYSPTYQDLAGMPISSVETITEPTAPGGDSPSTTETSSEDNEIKLNDKTYIVKIDVDIPGSEDKGVKVESEDGQTVYYFDEKAQVLRAYSEDGGQTFKNDVHTKALDSDIVILSTKAKGSVKKQKEAEEAAAKKKAEEEAKAAGTAAGKQDDKKTEKDDKAGLDKSSSTIAPFLDPDGDVIVCENKDCDPNDATFSFKHDSVFKGTEGYVYVTSAGKRCTAGQAAAGGDCKKTRCDGVKGCIHESEGNVYCTTFDGLERCAGNPINYIENQIKECDKIAYAGPGCAGAQKRMDATYDSLNFEFRSRVESVFGTLLDHMTKNFFSKMEYWMYDSMCQMDYYNTGSSDVDLISGVQITQENNYGFDMNYLDQGEVIVRLGGEKEIITETDDESIYRYSFSIQTIGPVHGLIYLYNYCTDEKSFGTGITGATGWVDEFAVNKPLGVHRIHYAGDETTYLCDDEASSLNKQECRFDHVCLKVLDNEDYTEPICNKLGGEDIILDIDTGDYTCGSMPANYYK